MTRKTYEITKLKPVLDTH